MSCLTIRAGRRSFVLGIVLIMTAILGVVLTSILTATAMRASARDPSVSAQVPSPTAATQVARNEWETMPVRRPHVAAAPSATAEPSEAPIPEAPIPEAPPAIQLVPLTLLTIDVWNAEERYFSVTGSTPDELMASAKANVPADPTGAERSAMAYAGPIAWDHRPSYVQDPSTGSCTMTAVASTVAYQATLPQWTAPSNVPLELQAWWLVVLEHIRVHEGQHIHIFEDYVRVLPARVVGQPCDAWDAIIGQWTAEVMAAHASFDAAESHWAFPTYAGPPDL